jgi:hypothetical protein
MNSSVQVPPLDEARSGRGALAVQVVIFQNPQVVLERFAAGLGAAIRSARVDHDLSQVAVRFGDCSPSRVIDDEGLASIIGKLGEGVDDVSYSFFDANLGSSGGSNALAELGDEEYVWVVNPETYPAPNCASELLAALQAELVAAVDARQIPVEHPKVYDLQTGDTGWASGACLMVRRRAFDEVGGFDDRFFPHCCDDVDLSWRLRLAGFRVVHAPNAPIYQDKRPNADGAVRAPRHEQLSGQLARLWLCRRYGRPDLEAEHVAVLESSEDEDHRALAAEYRSRLAAGDVPTELAGAASVAEFVDGEYTSHRFVY